MKIKETIILLILIVSFISCNELTSDKRKIQIKTKQINVKINYNVETLGLIYSLADTELVYSDFKESAHLLKYFLDKFKKYKSHPAVIKMKELLNKDIFESSSVTIGLFYTNFPEFNKKYDFDYSNYSEEEKKELFDFFELARKFYIDANLNQYFEKQEPLYTKIKSEIKSVLPKSKYIKTLEEFHGISMLDYVIIPSVFIPNYFNFGPRIKTKNGTINYYVLGPTYDIKIEDEINLKKNIGFNDKDYISSTGVHEFGHTFMRFIDKPKNVELINSISYLNTKDIQDKIYPQGYGTWEDVFEEHLVRTCEIVIASKMGNEKLKEELFNDYVKERGFKYIPLILKILPEYENNREKYKKFEDFFPLIIEELRTKTKHNKMYSS